MTTYVSNETSGSSAVALSRGITSLVFPPGAAAHHLIHCMNGRWTSYPPNFRIHDFGCYNLHMLLDLEVNFRTLEKWTLRLAVRRFHGVCQGWCECHFTIINFCHTQPSDVTQVTKRWKFHLLVTRLPSGGCVWQKLMMVKWRSHHFQLFCLHNGIPPCVNTSTVSTRLRYKFSKI